MTPDPTDEPQTCATVAAELFVEEGYAAGTRLRVERFPATVGRGREADVRLADDPQEPTISRRHLRLYLAHGQVYVQDISSNGIRLGSRILQPEEKAAVGDGVEVWLGSSTRVRITQRHLSPQNLPSPRATTLQACLLGRCAFTVMDHEIAPQNWSSRKAIVLLALLADTPQHPVSTDRILQELWPEDDGDQRQALQATVSRIRKPLRSGPGGAALPDPILHKHDAYTLTWDTTTDVLQFEELCRKGARLDDTTDATAMALEQAVGLYGGPFLEGITEAWAERRRAWLAGLVHEALERLARNCERLGQMQQALHWHDQVLRRSPCHEPSHIATLNCLLALGRRDDALNHYYGAVRAMRQQLGLEPSAALSAILARIGE